MYNISKYVVVKIGHLHLFFPTTKEVFAFFYKEVNNEEEIKKQTQQASTEQIMYQLVLNRFF